MHKQLHEYDYVQLEAPMQVYTPDGIIHDVLPGVMCQVQAYHEYGLDALTKEGFQLYLTLDECSPVDEYDAASYHGYDVR
jgi:hypothetical protein